MVITGTFFKNGWRKAISHQYRKKHLEIWESEGSFKLEHFPHPKHSEILCMRLKSPCRLSRRLPISNLTAASCPLLCGPPLLEPFPQRCVCVGWWGHRSVRWWKGAEKPLHPTASRAFAPQYLWTASDNSSLNCQQLSPAEVVCWRF